MSISIIAAIGKNYELGKGNDLIWHFKDDMKFFKDTTTGHTVVMGRKTFESLPHALPNRRNIVITRDASYTAEGAEVTDSIENAIKLAGDSEVFVIGGGTIYEAMLPMADKLYLTEIDAEDKDAEVYFARFDKSQYTREKLTDFTTNSGIHFEHILYTRK